MAEQLAERAVLVGLPQLQDPIILITYGALRLKELVNLRVQDWETVTRSLHIRIDKRHDPLMRHSTAAVATTRRLSHREPWRSLRGSVSPAQRV